MTDREKKIAEIRQGYRSDKNEQLDREREENRKLREERDITEVYVVRNRDKDILYVGLDWNKVESLLAQDASREYLSYGINAPEKEDTHDTN